MDEGNELQDARADLAHVEAVHAQESEKEGEKKGGHEALVADGGRDGRFCAPSPRSTIPTS